MGDVRDVDNVRYVGDIVGVRDVGGCEVLAWLSEGCAWIFLFGIIKYNIEWTEKYHILSWFMKFTLIHGSVQT